MKNVHPELLSAFNAALMKTEVPAGIYGQYHKWLRFYLDFCMKYNHPPRDSDSLEPFMQKLASKRQSQAAQEQAAESVSIYYSIVNSKNHKHSPDRPVYDQDTDWDAIYRLLKDEISVRQYSKKTLKTYRNWTHQFQKYLANKQPSELVADDAAGFLTHLATNQKVVASTQNQAFNALLFLYRHVLKVDYDLKDKVVRARRTKYIPVVLTREEVDRVIAGLEYPYTLITGLLYGCGLRLFECLNLRVGCVNMDDRILTVHDGKGKKDRTVPLPERIIPDLEKHLKRVYKLHEKDIKDGYDGVFMPGAIDRKWKNASKDLVWQWVFPSKTLTYVPSTKENRRYHVHETVYQRALRQAVRKAAIPKRVTAHTFRHSFASHLLLNNYDIRTIQEMLGHSDVRTTMIYTHTVKSRTLKERKSPLDF